MQGARNFARNLPPGCFKELRAVSVWTAQMKARKMGALSKIVAWIDDSSEGKVNDLSDRMIAAVKHVKWMDKSGKTTTF